MLEESREQVADLLGAQPVEVIFTSGGTEADNLAIKGSFGARARSEGRSRVVVSAIEHHAVLDPARWLASSAGADLTEIGVDSTGRVRLDELSAAVDDRTAVVSVLWANNEIGTHPAGGRGRPRSPAGSGPGPTATPCRRRVTCRSTSPPAAWI